MLFIVFLLSPTEIKNLNLDKSFSFSLLGLMSCVMERWKSLFNLKISKIIFYIFFSTSVFFFSQWFYDFLIEV